jgi:predicted dienelactone hydrolase
MKRIVVASAAMLLVGLVLGPALLAEEYKKAAGPARVEVAAYDWHDAARNRDVPVKIYWPAESDGPLPVIIFSHGLGGSRDGYEFLGSHWAGWGYVCVHLQHLGSDTAVWQGVAQPMDSMRRAAANPANLVNRPLDVRFAVDQMEKMNRDKSPLAGRLDMKRLGMAGHSFGAYTTLAAIGQVFILPTGREISLADPRIKAAIPMSAPVAAKADKLDKALGVIRIPCLHMTGTLDNSPIGDTLAADRRLPFDHSPGPNKYLVIFTGGDHMIFSGRGLGRESRPKDPVFHDLIRQSTTAFWDAYLKDNPAARKWLADGGFKAELGENGTFEVK